MIVKNLDTENISATYNLVRETIFNLPTYSLHASQEQIKVYSPDNLKVHIKNPDRLNIITILNNQVIGFLFGIVEKLPNANMFYLEWNGVTPECRKSGVMQNMWDAMDLWARVQKLDGILVDTLTNNQKMIKFLQKNKMNVWKETKNHWYGHDYFLWGKFYE